MRSAHVMNWSHRWGSGCHCHTIAAPSANSGLSHSLSRNNVSNTYTHCRNSAGAALVGTFAESARMVRRDQQRRGKLLAPEELADLLPETGVLAADLLKTVGE